MNERPDKLFASSEGPCQIQAAAEGQPCQACAVAMAAGASFCPQCGGDLRQDESKAPAIQAASSAEVPADHGHATPTPIEELVKAAVESQPSTDATPSEKAVDEAESAKCNCGETLPQYAQYCPKCGVQVGQKTPKYGLRHLAGANADQFAAIGDEEFTIGKSDDCNLVIASDEYVSRRHARIFQADGMLFLEDLNSSNGTFLRPRRRSILEAGDEIMIGTSVFRLEEAS